ncbi:membrane protein insertase YidC [Nodularia harveyana UHCC-0300]|uniref:Membrane protein insertase YidC n=1 Tax=Nodularia harveyana UHCC-0300 TaxID=2974287 RepID=A0ABU5UF33_9CYAN|nr:membrane protein insertase YidC [Nodularia harveyana]MEA5581913.1 membrane protein insertase YidC [Nodularia harveyana UHCC-0300]
MDFGIGFLSNNVMLPIIDFFYGIVPSYGLAIVALTLIIRFALYPLSAGSIRNMRKMRIVQPLMQKRMAEIKERYKDNPQKQQEEMVNVQKEFGNPLAGCLPLLLQMPVLLALFATLRGSPFAGVNYSVNLQVLPSEQIERIQPQAFATSPQSIYIADGERARVTAILPGGNKLAVGEKTKIQYQTIEGKPFQALLAEHPENNLVPQWTVTKGEERIKIDAEGNVEALEPGDVTIQGSIPGLAAEKGFLFIQALGRVGATNPDGEINWDIVSMILFFGVSLYVSQMISGQNSSGGNPQQDTVNKITPVIFSGMFFFFPLPAGVLMYMVIGNIFQTAQTYVLSREPLPEGLQEIVAIQEKEVAAETKNLPFEPKSSKKKTTG